MILRQCTLDDCAEKFKKYLDETERPSVIGFSAKYFLPRSTIYDWAKRDPRIKDLISICGVRQENALVEQGLENKINSTITKLVLSTNYGYKERNENTGDENRPEQKKITIEMAPKDAAKVYAEMIKGE